MATITPLLTIATSMRTASQHFARAESMAGMALSRGSTAPLYSHNAARAFAAGIDDANRAMNLLSASPSLRSTQRLADLTQATLTSLRDAAGRVFVDGPGALVTATGRQGSNVTWSSATNVVNASRSFAGEMGAIAAVPFKW